MRIEKARWFYFRNLSSAPVTFSSELNLLIGPNGSGKTNLIEGLNLLCGWGTFDNQKLQNLITWGHKKGLLLAQGFENDPFHLRIELNSTVQITLNNQKSNSTQLRSILPCLSFLPSHMMLIEGSPKERRRFLDLICSLIFPLYPKKLNDLRRLTTLRNKTLYRGSSTQPYDMALAPVTGFIWRCREKIVEGLRRFLPFEQQLCSHEPTLQLVRGGAGYVFDPYEDYLLSVEKTRKKEFSLKTTLVSPSRDDVEFCFENRKLSEVMSRGQRRRFVLALILTASRLIEQELGRPPLLLIDELSSDLDRQSQQLVMESLIRRQCQVVATAAEWNGPRWKGKTLYVQSGEIKEGNS